MSKPLSVFELPTAQPNISTKALKVQPSDPLLDIQIQLRCLSSKQQPYRPSPISTSGSIFDNAKPEYGHLDNLAQTCAAPA